MSSTNTDGRRLRLIEEILRLPDPRLAELEQFLRVSPVPARESPSAQGKCDWPHAPLHRISEHGTYIVTAGTYRKEHHFSGPERLDYLQTSLLTAAKESGWQLEAWAVFPNHYHFVAHSCQGSESLAVWIARLHEQTACFVNRLDGLPGRRVWFSYWDTQLTFETSYFARLNYVHQNAVKHGLVRVANQYGWCSAAWFERTATVAQVGTVYGFKIDQIQVRDDFDPA